MVKLVFINGFFSIKKIIFKDFLLEGLIFDARYILFPKTKLRVFFFEVLKAKILFHFIILYKKIKQQMDKL
jgi:hypothetical protein